MSDILTLKNIHLYHGGIYEYAKEKYINLYTERRVYV